ncbi:uncharacterized protein [Coffea arabica]|uniref:Uncharacterized protein n=1 Tax=Coffea arabica TaxID=13443 RepID=A0A6P6UI53_COFAR
MTLRSGKEVEGPESVIPNDKDEEKIENEFEKEDSNGTDPKVLPDPVITVKINPQPFPSRLEKPKKQDKDKEILEVFRMVEINIPLLDAIKQVPKYAKFLRDLCINRRRLRGDERVIIAENVSAEMFETVGKNELDVALIKHLELEITPEVEWSEDLKYTIGALHSLSTIAKREHKEAIGWTIVDIKGISPSVCIHRIWLEEDTKPVRQAQMRLNPLMMEVVKKEILKLLDVGIIFAISDNPWMSPIQAVPKKAGVTVEANQTGELMPVRKPIGWRQCIVYRRLNAVTKKDHFALRFIDQMVERLACRAYYYFLNEFSGYF